MNILTVSQLNTWIKSLLEDCKPLNNLYISGEISNFVHYYKSGHMYFTLKDDKCQIKAVLFYFYAQRLRFEPADGMKVLCRGRVSLYERDGTYQFYVEDMQPDGIGALSLAYEQLKEKLSAEGLFDEKYKKPLPAYPQKIGVVTSNMGAAVEDIKNITKRRYPLAELVIVPTLVQGESAAPDIVRAITALDALDDIDVIIVGRGGGSIEDLLAFNTEMVARAVFQCKKPVISAVGHETDFTICDFVADKRASTPSAAAEIAVPDIRDLNDQLKSCKNLLSKLLVGKLRYEQQRLDHLSNAPALKNANSLMESLSSQLEAYNKRMENVYLHRIEAERTLFCESAAKLDALSPLAVLSRGYSVTTKDSKVIKSIVQLRQKDEISVILYDGKITASVNEVHHDK